MVSKGDRFNKGIAKTGTCLKSAGKAQAKNSQDNKEAEEEIEKLRIEATLDGGLVL